MAANPNTISAGIQETWDKEYQVTHHKIPTYPAWATFRLAAGLKKGDTVHRQYRTELVANDMEGDGGYTRQAIVDTDETLAINKEKEASFYIKELDEIQNHLPTRAKHAFDASAAIFNQIDGDLLGQYDQYTNDLDDGNIGGTDGNGITLSPTNVRQVFTRAQKLLQRNSIHIQNNARFTGFRKEDMGNVMPVALISPDVYQNIIEYLDGKDSTLGDKVALNGNAGMFMGFNLFISNGIGWSGTLVLITTPTDGDTVVVNGVTFTFKTTLGSTAGNVLIGGSADVARANLTGLINTPGTTDANGVALSTANQNLLKNIVATNDNTADTMVLKATGRGYIVVSETLTAAADIWTLTKQIQHVLIGVNNAVDIVIQKTPNLKIKDRDGKVGSDVVTWTAYGSKVFNEQKPMMIDVKVRTDAY